MMGPGDCRLVLRAPAMGGGVGVGEGEGGECRVEGEGKGEEGWLVRVSE